MRLQKVDAPENSWNWDGTRKKGYGAECGDQQCSVCPCPFQRPEGSKKCSGGCIKVCLMLFGELF